MAEDQKDQKDQETEDISTEIEEASQKTSQETTQETKQELDEGYLETVKESVAKDVSEKVSKSVLQQIGEKLGLTKKETEELPDDKKQLLEEVDKRFEQRWEEQNKKREEEERLSQDEERKKVDSVIANWYAQYNNLAQSGKVPKIEKADDEKDPGIRARRRLIIEIGKEINRLKQQGSSYIPTISDILVNNPQVLSAPPGDDLPISGNTQVLESMGEDKYSDIAGKSFEQIAKEGSQF